MVLPGHLAGGYLAAYSLLALSHVSFSGTDTAILLAIGILAGEAPDVDLIPFYFEYKKDRAHKISHHREYFTHAPIVWIGFSLAISLLGFIFNSIFMEFAGLVVLVSSLSHFILDSIEHGIRWIWPFSNRRFFILEATYPNGINERKGTFSYYWKFIFSTYIKRYSFYVEILITLIALFVAFWR